MKKWPDEVVTWLRVNVPGKTTQEITVLINQQGFDSKYNLFFTEGMIKCAKNRYKIKSGTPCGHPKGYSSKYPTGMADYIQNIASGKKVDDIAAMVSEHFGIEFTPNQCRAYKKNHGIVSGVDCRFPKGHIPVNKGRPMSPAAYEKCKSTMFQPGHVPVNRMKVGSYTHTTDGYLIQKIKDTGPQSERFQFVHRAVWEQHNGPIPPGKMVSFLDGDKDNCDIENLALIENDENLEMNRSKLRFNTKELTEAGLMIAKLTVTTRKRKRGCDND